MSLNISSAFTRSPWILTGPVIAILLGHYVVDTYSSVIPPLIGVVQTEFSMQPQWAALLLGIGSIFSGLAQPVFAWLSDKTGSRAFGPLGILLAAVGIGLIGYSSNTTMVFLIFSIAMTGVGMFHPIATARIGSIAGDQRNFALSLFFVFGMAGFFTGSLFVPQLTTGLGSLKSLSYLIPPGLLMVVLLQANINKRTKNPHLPPSSVSSSMADYDWRSIFFLYVSAVFRFLVNMAIFYAIVRWIEQYIADANPEMTAKTVSHIAAPIAGQAIAVTIVGQGIGGLVAGATIGYGNERWPLMITPILFAPSIVVLAFVDPGLIGYVACFFAGVGFASMTPITISVGQRLMPGHTRLASGLMLGGAWTIAAIGPRSTEFLINRFDLKTAFFAIAAALVCAGISVIGIGNVRAAKATP